LWEKSPSVSIPGLADRIRNWEGPVTEGVLMRAGYSAYSGLTDRDPFRDKDYPLGKSTAGCQTRCHTVPMDLALLGSNSFLKHPIILCNIKPWYNNSNK